MSDLSERIAKLKELEAKATQEPFDTRYANYLRNNALDIIEELEAENEELKQEFVGKFEAFMPPEEAEVIREHSRELEAENKRLHDAIGDYYDAERR